MSNLTKPVASLKSCLVKKTPIDILFHRIEDMKNGEKKFLLGNVLTVIDGLFADPQQRKAVKDIIEQLWYQRNYFWYLEELLEDFRIRFTKFEPGQMHPINSGNGIESIGYFSELDK
jgi:hypothetical protein